MVKRLLIVLLITLLMPCILPVVVIGLTALLALAGFIYLLDL